MRPEVLADLQSDYIAALPKYIGKGGHYPSFLRFFQLEIDQRGGDWRSVLRQYLFPGCQDDQAGEDAALELLSRLYSGFMHPMLHLMFGIEWDQPALVAEALAQTAVHPDDAKLRRFFVESEKKASAGNNDQEYGTHFADIFQQAAKSDTLRESSPYHEASDPRVALYHGVLTRAYDEVVDLAAAMTVPQRHLKEKMAEASHVSALVATMAAWRPPHIPKFDFYFMYACSIVYPAIEDTRLTWP